MTSQTKSNQFLIFFLVLFPSTFLQSQKLDEYYYQEPQNVLENISKGENNFNGYTNYWHDVYKNSYRFGNLYKMEVADVEKTLLQTKIDIAEDFGLPGLIMQEGFLKELFLADYAVLDNPSLKKLNKTLDVNKNIVAFVDSQSEVGQKLGQKITQEVDLAKKLNSHQFNAKDFVQIRAFYLEKANSKLFVISSKDKSALNTFKQLIETTKNVISKYDMHKGWFGAYTLLNSVTITKGHPLEVIGTGMNEGNSWFVFDGYMDYLSKNQIQDWVKKVNLPIVTDVGAGNVFGASNYDGFQIQQMFDTESWVKFAKEKKGYVFRKVWDTVADPYKYDGYFATEGNKEQINKEDVPFVLKTGQLDKGALSSMVLFIEKGEALTNKSMWNAIMDRREVGVLEKGQMIGPAEYRNALQMLLLDRVYLEEYFGDPININADVKGYDLKVVITNTSGTKMAGNLEIGLPSEVQIKGDSSMKVALAPKETKTISFKLRPKASAMDNTNPIAVHFKHKNGKKSTLTMLDLPPTISVHRLLYAHAPLVEYPVTIHNYTEESSFPVKIEAINSKKKTVFKTLQNCNAKTGTFSDLIFNLKLKPGSYNIKVTALGQTYNSQLGVGRAKGKPTLTKIDLNDDGIHEYQMENDSVQVTLLATGARVIEYKVKSKNDNLLFKLWPKKAIDDKREFRKRGYYPYGGFEDFLGQGSMETHEIYNAEIVQEEGDYVRVKMSTDYFGNYLEKTFTLYGNSPLLEVRYALTFINPEANVLGPQPILELGEKHWTEDVFMVPTLNGVKELRMMPDNYYGEIFNLSEGWNAGYDTEEDLTFLGAYPVDQPLFLHMWMNHPKNRDAHHYYTEFQPWLPIFQKSTMYFTYYLWGAAGPWENGLQMLRQKNLITTRKAAH